MLATFAAWISPGSTRCLFVIVGNSKAYPKHELKATSVSCIG